MLLSMYSVQKWQMKHVWDIARKSGWLVILDIVVDIFVGLKNAFKKCLHFQC